MSDNKEFRHNLSPYDHNVRQEKLVREYQIAIENMDIIRERLAECVRTEHVNQFVNCKELREKYWTLCKDRYHGMLFPADSEPKNRVTNNFTNK
jgi:hypothetical protein